MKPTTVEPQSLGLLAALNRSGKHIYAGTVPAHVVAKRRARNRVARVSRRINRVVAAGAR